MRDAGAQVEEIAFNVSDGRDPYQTWRGVWMVGQQFENLRAIESFGPNLKGNVEAGLKVTALDIAAAERKRLEVFHRFRAVVRAVRHPAYTGGTGEAVSGGAELPHRDQWAEDLRTILTGLRRRS